MIESVCSVGGDQFIEKPLPGSTGTIGTSCTATGSSDGAILCRQYWAINRMLLTDQALSRPDQGERDQQQNTACPKNKKTGLGQ
jgi:hypothetical protein